MRAKISQNAEKHRRFQNKPWIYVFNDSKNRVIISTKPRERKFHKTAETNNRHSESNVASAMETGLRVAVQMIIHVKALPPLEQNS